MLILCRDIGLRCRRATSWCDLDLTFDFALVTLRLKILSGLIIRKCKVWEVGMFWGHWFGVVVLQRHGVTSM